MSFSSICRRRGSPTILAFALLFAASVASISTASAANAPPTISGQIEVRGVGILPMAIVAQVPVALLVRLSADVERLPEPATRSIAGVAIPEIALDPHQHSAPIKVELALRHLLE